MRRVLVDLARRRQAKKGGGELQRVSLCESDVSGEAPSAELESLDTALDDLARQDAAMMELVQLRYFAGLSIEATARVLGSSPATVKRQWIFARAWLLNAIDQK